MSNEQNDPTAAAPRFTVAGLDLAWNPATGVATMNGIAHTTLFRDSSLASLMSGFHAMVGSERFALALQAEGSRGTDTDWQIISQFASFEEGFEVVAGYAAVAGWGRWRLAAIDRIQQELRFEVTESWEGHVQRLLGIRWGAGLAGGKFSDFGTRLFGTHCRAELLATIADGHPADVLVVRPSSVSLAQELEAMLSTEQATRADLARALHELKELSNDRERALGDRERMVVELRDQIGVIERQQEAIRAMSTPIIQVWDGVLVVPVVGIIDAARTADIMEKLLEELVKTKSRYAILDLTGVDTIDTSTAENFLKVAGGVQLLGARGVIAGINPQVAQTIVALGVNLGQLGVYANLKEALKAAIRSMAETGGRP
jgi:rsbT co-antagonist protein RsbR